MRIAFLQKYPFPYFGVMALSAGLPPEVEREVFIGDLERDAAASAAAFSPDVLALPVMSLEYSWMLEQARRVKALRPSVIVVAGYIHATACPEMVAEEGIDAVCVGEGDRSFPRFLDALRERGKAEPLPGFWVKRGGEIVPGGEPEPILDLDALPEEDRDLYYRKYPSLRDERLKHFMASRGCPFDCAFCCHQVYSRLYRGRGRYVRRKSPERVIAEIAGVKKRYGLSSICFLDDVFIMDIGWLKRFTDLYRREIRLPYFCAITPPNFTPEIARLLKESGCHTVNFGVETASERKRFEVLNKRVTDAEMLAAARLIKEQGMKLQTTVMFGLPFETVDEAFENIRFNLRLGADFLASNLLLPFPKTAIEESARKAGILDPDYLRSPEYRGIHLNSVFRFPGIETIERVQKISHLAMRFPALLPLFRRLVRVRSKRLFFLIYVLSSLWRYKSEKPISWAEAAKVFWRARKNYLRYLSGSPGREKGIPRTEEPGPGR